MRSIPALCAVLFAGIGLSACGGGGGGGVPSGSVAQVGNSAITTDQFNHWMQIAALSSTTSTTTKPNVAVPVPPDYTACIAQKRATAAKSASTKKAPTTAQLKAQCVTQYNQLSSEVLNYLISASWVLGEASDQKISVTNAAVQKEFNTEKSQQFSTQKAYQQFLANSGQTQQDILFKVRLNLLSQKIQAKVTGPASKVATAKAQTYYNQHISSYSTPESRDLQIIRTTGQAQAQAAIGALQSGQAFATVAKRYSVDPTKSQGGVEKGVTRGQEVQTLDNAVFTARTGALSGPLKTIYGYYIFKVQNVTPAKTRPFSAVESTIKQQLASQGEQSALNAFLKTYQSKWKARTNCRSGYVVSVCKNYNAPKTSSTTTGG
jgi:foldase protein PrsA